MKRHVILIAGLLLGGRLAHADPKNADEWYAEGSKQYDLGNFDKAIEAFKKGFELEPSDNKKSAYLFNLAQAYRQAGNCKDAQFFYKRYLAFKDNDTKKPLEADKRKEIEDRISELDACAKQQEAIRQKPPETNPDGTKVDGTKPDGTKPDDKRVATGNETPPPGGDLTSKAEPWGPPKVVSLRLAGGGAKLSTGDLDVPLQATVALLGGYPLAVAPKLTLELGAGFTFTPVPFEDAMGASKSASMTGLLANVGAVYEVASKVNVRGEVGAGMLLFGGASESPFTDFAATSGTLSMFHLRVGVSGDFALSRNVIATVAPFTFSYSPAKTGLRDDIKSITAIDFMVGLGYRM